MAPQKGAVCEFPAPKGIQGRCMEQLPSVLSLCEVLKGLHCTSARRLTQGASRLVPMEQGTDALQWQQVESAYEACDRLWVDALQTGLGALKGGAANVPASGTVAASQENGIYQLSMGGKTAFPVGCGAVWRGMWRPHRRASSNP